MCGGRDSVNNMMFQGVRFDMASICRIGIYIAKMNIALDRAVVLLLPGNRHFGRHQEILCLTCDVHGQVSSS
jgi:hypothetical protein